MLAAREDPHAPGLAKDFKKHLVIRKNKRHASGYTVNCRCDAIDSKLQYTGWMVLISNHIGDAGQALELYRSKDVVEKAFMKMKNCLDLGRLRVHSDHRMQGKLFVGFVALIVMAHIHKVMSKNNLYECMSMKKMLKSLERLRVQYVNGHKILYPLSSELKAIFKAFKLSLPL